jgi:hypothetical protein
MSNDRALWSMVILQARDDLADEPIGSIEYENAISFFTAAFGPWAQSREAIADQLGFHADDIERLGRTVIAARRAAEGLPPEAPSVESKPAAQPAPLPALVAIPAPPPANDNRRRRAEHMKSLCNPFNPFRHQA